MKLKILFLSFFILFVYLVTEAQVLDPQEILRQNADKIEVKRKEAASKGISEAELQQRLKEKGYDLSNLQPSQFTSLEGATDEAIAELEREKAAAQIKAAEIKERNENKSKILTEDQTKANKEEGEKAPRTRGLDDFDFTPENEKSAQQTMDNNQIDIQEQANLYTDSVKEPDLDKVSIYGQQLFINTNAKAFTNSTDLIPANDYLLGSGDEIRVVIFGRSIFDGSFEIDKDGYIDPKSFPKIYLKGIQFGNAKELIASRFAQRYTFNRSQIEISLKRSRTITVGVYGEVNNPGSFTYPAANSAFNLIVLARGLTHIGSVRNIQIITPGKGVRIYDVYKAMSDPLKSANIYLQMNDFIQVPVAGKVVKISGAINRPFNYELLPTETLTDLIKYAGGYSAAADQEIIQVVRYENGARNIIELNNTQAKSYIPQNGDEVTIIQFAKEIRNLITISGEVERPGDFSWVSGLKVADALRRSRTLRTTKMDVAFVVRTNQDNSFSYKKFSPERVLANPSDEENYELMPLDKILIFANPDFTQYYKINVSGAVRSPGAFDYDAKRNLRVADLITLAEGLKPEALNRGYLIRTDSATDTREYIQINVVNALLDQNSADNILLKPLDRILILSQSLLHNESFVSVNGSVKNPGRFKFGSDMTLMDAIVLAGGFKMEAASNKIDVYRVIMQNNEPTKVVAATFELNKDLIASQVQNLQTILQPFDIIEVRSVPDFELQQMVVLEGEVKYPGRYALTKKNMLVSEVIAMAGGLNKDAFAPGAQLYRSNGDKGIVIIELDKVLKNPSLPNNIVLLDGDRIIIPKRNDIVSIKGAVNIQDVYTDQFLMSRADVNVAFKGRKSAKYYIDEFAGGFKANADKDRVFVEYPNGKKIKTDHFLGIRIYPKVEKGSVISVAAKAPQQEKLEPKEKANWSKIIADSVAQATAILTLVLLINTLNKS